MIILLNIIIVALFFVSLMVVAVRLDRRIDALDEAIFQYMKEEHNARVGTDE